MNKKFHITIIILLMSITYCFAGSVPPLINFQGKLTKPITGTKKIEFNIYDSKTAGNKIWGPQIFDNTPIINGHFNVILGSTDINGKLISSAFTSSSRFIAFKLDDGQEIAPRQQILSVPNSFNATHADRADKATHAINADNANNSKTSDQANFAKNSSNANYASRAGQANIEIDPTVPPDIKDGIHWNEIQGKPGLKGSCQISEWSEWDKGSGVDCGEGYLAGIVSWHNNSREDRRFAYKCCFPAGVSQSMHVCIGEDQEGCVPSGW